MLQYPPGIEVPSKLGALTRGLFSRGYGERDVLKILRGNLLRVLGEVWK